MVQLACFDHGKSSVAVPAHFRSWRVETVIAIRSRDSLICKEAKDCEKWSLLRH